MNSFNTLMEILSGLNHSAIQRLGFWDNIKEKYKQTFESLEVLMRGQGNYKNYRQLLECRKEPILPYFGKIQKRRKFGF